MAVLSRKSARMRAASEFRHIFFLRSAAFPLITVLRSRERASLLGFELKVTKVDLIKDFLEHLALSNLRWTNRSICNRNSLQLNNPKGRNLSKFIEYFLLLFAGFLFFSRRLGLFVCFYLFNFYVLRFWRWNAQVYQVRQEQKLFHRFIHKRILLNNFEIWWWTGFFLLKFGRGRLQVRIYYRWRLSYRLNYGITFDLLQGQVWEWFGFHSKLFHKDKVDWLRFCGKVGDLSPDERQALFFILSQKKDFVSFFKELPEIDGSILTHQYAEGYILLLR